MPSTVWPILATMFMFRLLIYVYELKHARGRESLIDTISYFFLLPNFCFPHFPVVDYRTMQRGYFASDVHALQRRGLQMMHRGTLHLLCYRLIYHELLVPASQVHGPWSLAGYLVCNYLLYLRVSGQFHMACGMLHLFGYQLPDTHHWYLLATGFTDYWRRINIYWKDFMVRLFFNPVVFRLKRWPQPSALAMATVTVFLATWVLHAYQSFWLRGTWGFSLPDALFWGVLGVLVLINVQLDARRSRDRSQGQGPVVGSGAMAERDPTAGDPRPQDRGHLHHHRRALVALVESQPGGLAGPDASWNSRGLTRSQRTMATPQTTTTLAAARIAMLQSVAILAVAILPWPQSWTGFRSVIASCRSLRAEPRRA